MDELEWLRGENQRLAEIIADRDEQIAARDRQLSTIQAVATVGRRITNAKVIICGRKRNCDTDPDLDSECAAVTREFR